MLTLFWSSAFQGLAIAALSCAFALVYWSTRVFFVALGSIFVLAPFVVVDLQPLLGLRAAAGLAVAAVTGLSLLLGWLNHERLLRTKASNGVHFACSLSIYFVTAELIALRWGSEARSLTTLFGLSALSGRSEFIVPRSQMVAIVTCLLLVAALFATLCFTGQGVRLRALADNPAELSRSGYNPVLLRAMAYGVSGAVAGCASIGLAADLAVSAHGGMAALIPAATATLLTPLGHWRRLLAWSLAMGFLRVMVTFLVSGAWQDPVTLGLLLLGLVWRRRSALQGWGVRLALRGAQ